MNEKEELNGCLKCFFCEEHHFYKLRPLIFKEMITSLCKTGTTPANREWVFMRGNPDENYKICRKCLDLNEPRKCSDLINGNGTKETPFLVSNDMIKCHNKDPLVKFVEKN